MKEKKKMPRQKAGRIWDLVELLLKITLLAVSFRAFNYSDIMNEVVGWAALIFFVVVFVYSDKLWIKYRDRWPLEAEETK